MSAAHEARLLNDALPLLIGRKIVGVQYITSEDAAANLWNGRCVFLILDNGTQIIPVADDEGNNGGALSIATSDGRSLELGLV